MRSLDTDHVVGRLLKAATSEPGLVWAHAAAEAAPGALADEIVMMQDPLKAEMVVVWARHAGSFASHYAHQLLRAGDTVDLVTTWITWVLRLADLVENSTAPAARLQSALLRWTAAYGAASEGRDAALLELHYLHQDGAALTTLIDQGGLGLLTAADLIALRDGARPDEPPGWPGGKWAWTRRPSHERRPPQPPYPDTH